MRKEDGGRPLLEYLSARFRYACEAEWAAFIASGEVTLNGSGADCGRLLVPGDRVAFVPLGLQEPPAELRFDVVLEREDFLVVDKPANLPCHPAGRYFAHTLQQLLSRTYGTVHLVGRLDRETSGLLLAARNPGEARRLGDLQASGRMRKTYAVLVHGEFPQERICRGYLAPDGESAVRKKRRYLELSEAAALPPGAEACGTRFELLSRGGGLSLLRAELLSGRTHQIRATLCSLGYPLVGDKLYGLDETIFLRFAEGRMRAADRELLILDRQALHSESLSFVDAAGRSVELRSEAPFGPGGFPPPRAATGPEGSLLP